MIRLVRFLVGPIGSGKSMACIMEILRRASMQAPNGDGVRQTKWVAVQEHDEPAEAYRAGGYTTVFTAHD